MKECRAGLVRNVRGDACPEHRIDGREVASLNGLGQKARRTALVSADQPPDRVAVAPKLRAVDVDYKLKGCATLLIGQEHVCARLD
jgi:hypothetical protein